MASRLVHKATRSEHEHDEAQPMRATSAPATPPDGEARMFSPSFPRPLSEPERKDTEVSRYVSMYVIVP